MITHKSFLATINSLGHQGVDMNCNDVHLSYLPMAHVFERLCSIAMLFAGG